MEITESLPPIKVFDNESINSIIIVDPKAWCLLTNEIITHHMMTWKCLSNGG